MDLAHCLEESKLSITVTFQLYSIYSVVLNRMASLSTASDLIRSPLQHTLPSTLKLRVKRGFEVKTKVVAQDPEEKVSILYQLVVDLNMETDNQWSLDTSSMTT